MNNDRIESNSDKNDDYLGLLKDYQKIMALATLAAFFGYVSID